MHAASVVEPCSRLAPIAADSDGCRKSHRPLVDNQETENAHGSDASGPYVGLLPLKSPHATSQLPDNSFALLSPVRHLPPCASDATNAARSPREFRPDPGPTLHTTARGKFFLLSDSQTVPKEPGASRLSWRL